MVNLRPGAFVTAVFTVVCFVLSGLTVFAQPDVSASCAALMVAETGEIINIDGKGNRLAALAFGKKRVFIVAGVNKLCDDFDSALYRARNVAATQNATRFDVKTPCKIDGKCHDCRSPQRICNSRVWLERCYPAGRILVLLIDEEAGL